MKIRVIVNPASQGGKGAKVWRKIEKEERFDDVKFTGGPEDATRIASESEGFDVVVAFGGDGTINEVVNGLMKIPKGKRPALGIIPVGTGSDFIKTVGIPRDSVRAVEVLRNGKKRKIDVALCKFKATDGSETERYYINITEFGLGGLVANMVNRYGKGMGKILGGWAPFFFFAVTCNFAYRNKTVKLRSDNKEFSEVSVPVRVVAVANGRFYGGGMQIAPFADPYDGLLDVVVISMGPFEALRNLPLVYKGAEGLEKVRKTGKVFWFRCTELHVEGSDGLWIEMEGEVPGHSPTLFKILPKELDIIVP